MTQPKTWPDERKGERRLKQLDYRGAGGRSFEREPHINRRKENLGDSGHRLVPQNTLRAPEPAPGVTDEELLRTLVRVYGPGRAQPNADAAKSIMSLLRTRALPSLSREHLAWFLLRADPECTNDKGELASPLSRHWAQADAFIDQFGRKQG